MGFSPWQQLKSKRISYLTLPLLIMATVVEFVILATGWKYQQIACLPQGMGVTFFGIGPIGATILAVELLKLPLAIWTASRVGWQKGFMLVVGLPLICVLTFQLVKDMGVYEMSTAMMPASHLLEKASAEETRIAHLNGDLVAIEGKKADRERKLAELTAKKAKGRSELEESIKRNQDARQDAISLTDYQKKELSDVEARQATIIKQFDADTAQLTKALAELRARRETEVPRAAKWNAEEARIDNAYKTKLAAYTNKKSAYEKDRKEYESANVLKRQLMREPVDPGVPPERESNTILKPMLVAEIDAQIKIKEDELAAVNNKRRDRVAQVDADARKVREEFDRRSSAKREESDRKREELSTALAALAAEWKAEEKQIDQELGAAVQKVDGIRAELDIARKQAEGFYEARETAIRNTQVHRIATTVEIVRGLIKGERPMSIKASAKERGDILTDQISMVRIWVYPVLAFIVAFLPTLMVELGFSTLFHRDEQRRPYRVGFLGRRLHWLYTRAGRVKIARAERMAREATATLTLRNKALANEVAAQEKTLANEVAARDEALANAITIRDQALAAAIAARDEALASAKTSAEQALIEKETEAQSARAAIEAAAAVHEEQLKQKKDEWVAKFASLADSLNRAVAEKDALRDFQKAEIERQVQLRQNSWSDRLTQMRQELDAQRTTSETERAAMIQENHQKFLEVSEDCKSKVIQARRQAADAELAAAEKLAKQAYELKDALSARDMAVSQLQQQTESLSLKLTQAKDEAARELEKAARQEKHRSERQQLEFVKSLRQRDDELAHQLKQREEELTLEFDARLVKEKTRVDEDARHREEELERQLEVQVREVDARWKQEVQQREEVVQTRLKQREQQLQVQAAQELRRVESEMERQFDAKSREADARLKQELQQKDLEFQAKLKQREQDLATRAAARDTELQNQWAADLRVREEEAARQTEARVRATETRLGQEARQKEELLEIKFRQREQQLQAEFDARQAEITGQTEHFRRRRDVELADAGQRALRELEVQLRQEMQKKEEMTQAKARHREQELLGQLHTQAEASQLAAQEREKQLEQLRRNTEPLKALLARTEKERDDARHAATEGVHHVQDMEKKLSEASSLLTGWKNGKSSAAARVGRDVLQVVPIGSGPSGEQ